MFNLKGQKPVRILGANAFGDCLTLEQVKAAFAEPGDKVAVRAIGQIALALREQCVSDSFASMQAELPTQSACHQGAANLAAELAQIIADLCAGRVGDTAKTVFSE